mgnify:FL=1
MKLTIETTGQPQLIRALDNVERGFTDLDQSGIWKKVQSEFFKVEKELFDSEGASGQSGAWEKLTDNYAKVKERQFGKLPILQRSKELFKSLTSETDNTIADFKADEATFGTSLPYSGAVHKKRPAISPTDDQITQICKPIQTELQQLIERERLS